MTICPSIETIVRAAGSLDLAPADERLLLEHMAMCQKCNARFVKMRQLIGEIRSRTVSGGRDEMRDGGRALFGQIWLVPTQTDSQSLFPNGHPVVVLDASVQGQDPSDFVLVAPVSDSIEAACDKDLIVPAERSSFGIPFIVEVGNAISVRTKDLLRLVGELFDDDKKSLEMVWQWDSGRLRMGEIYPLVRDGRIGSPIVSRLDSRWGFHAGERAALAPLNQVFVKSLVEGEEFEREPVPLLDQLLDVIVLRTLGRTIRYSLARLLSPPSSPALAGAYLDAMVEGGRLPAETIVLSEHSISKWGFDSEIEIVVRRVENKGLNIHFAFRPTTDSIGDTLRVSLHKDNQVIAAGRLDPQLHDVLLEGVLLSDPEWEEVQFVLSRVPSPDNEESH